MIQYGRKLKNPDERTDYCEIRCQKKHLLYPENLIVDFVEIHMFKEEM